MKKKLNFEDEKVIPSEDNNCFGFDKEEEVCCVFTTAKMTETDYLNCGTLNCPFYKPKEHKDSIKHITSSGISFETREEYAERTGIEYLLMSELKQYECFPHASPESVDREYKKYLAAQPKDDPGVAVVSALPFMTKTDLIATASAHNIKVDARLKKDEIIELLTECLA